MPTSQKLTAVNASHETKKPQTTLWQNMATGSVAGAMEVLIDHPLWSMKTRYQAKEPFTLSPRILYRGLVPNVLSMAPITAVQVSLDRCFKNVFFSETESLSSEQRIASAFLGGVGSAFISGPTEMLMTHQRKTKDTFPVVAKRLMAESGWKCFSAGLPATMMRDGIFTACFLAVRPILKPKIQPYCANDFLASSASGIVAGMVATLLSQTFDTVKADQQEAYRAQPMGFKQAVKKRYATEGVSGLFRGGMWRGVRVASAVTIMGFVADAADGFFNQHSRRKY